MLLRFFQFQWAGRESTNVQIGHVSVFNNNYYVIYVGSTQQSSSGSSKTPTSDVQQITNKQSQESIGFLIGNYQVILFCLTAKVIDVGPSYPVAVGKDKIVFKSNVSFVDPTGVQFIIAIPNDMIPCAPSNEVSVVFASNIKGRLLACGVYNDASGACAHVKLGPDWNYLNAIEVALCLSSFVSMPLFLALIFYFVAFEHVYYELIYMFFVIAFWGSILWLRHRRTLQFIEQKHDLFLAHLAEASQRQ